MHVVHTLVAVLPSVAVMLGCCSSRPNVGPCEIRHLLLCWVARPVAHSLRGRLSTRFTSMHDVLTPEKSSEEDGVRADPNASRGEALVVGARASRTPRPAVAAGVQETAMARA